MMAIDPPLLENTADVEPRPLAADLVAARADLMPMVGDILSIPEEALTRSWSWIGGGEEEVRYGAYRAAELFERAEADARIALGKDVSAGDRTATIIAPATAGRWDLKGLLLPLPEVLLDEDPGEEQWPLRHVIGHVISGQRRYGWGTAWWQAHPHDLSDPNLPPSVPDSLWETQPDEEKDEGAGTRNDVLARLDFVLDASTERLAGMPADRLGYAGRWSGFAVDLGFRLSRWSSHIREHTIQVEKTLAMLGHPPTEPDRLVRHVLATYGRAESVVFGSAADGTEAPDIIRRAASEARAAVASARAAAG
jgi:hypothetical protein